MTLRITALLVFAFMLMVGCSTQGELMPLEPTSTPLQSFVIDPLEVSFSELQSDPQSYQDEVIQVAGNFQRLPLPECIPNGGPDARWSLVSENLRLDVVGFEALLNLVREPAALTLDGIFRLYEAPLGCGKEPDVGTAWFLEALTLVEPNPVQFGRPLGEVFDMIGDIPDFPTRTPLPVMTATPEQAVTAIPTPTTDQLPTPMATITVLVTMTPEVSATPTLSGSATGTTTVTPTATGPTMTTTVTPTPTSLTPTVEGSTTPTQTPAPGDTAVPLPTATTGEGGGGYPPPPNPYP